MIQLSFKFHLSVEDICNCVCLFSFLFRSRYKLGQNFSKFTQTWKCTKKKKNQYAPHGNALIVFCESFYLRKESSTGSTLFFFFCFKWGGTTNRLAMSYTQCTIQIITVAEQYRECHCGWRKLELCIVILLLSVYYQNFNGERSRKQ